MQEEKELTYTDPSTGNKLYGFSHRDMEKIYKLLWVLVFMIFLAMVTMGYVIWKVEAYNIVGKYIARCVC